MTAEAIPTQQLAKLPPMFSAPVLDKKVLLYQSVFPYAKSYGVPQLEENVRCFFNGFKTFQTQIRYDGFSKIILAFAKDFFYEEIIDDVQYYVGVIKQHFSTGFSKEEIENAFNYPLNHLLVELNQIKMNFDSKAVRGAKSPQALAQIPLAGIVQKTQTQWLDRTSLKKKINWLGTDKELSILFHWLFDKGCIFEEWKQLAAGEKSEIAISSKIVWRKPDNQLAVLLQTLVGAKKSWIGSEWVQMAQAIFGSPHDKPISKNLAQLAQKVVSKNLEAWRGSIREELIPKLNKA